MRDDDSQAAFFGSADSVGDGSADSTRRRKMFFALLRGRWAWAISFSLILGGVGAYFGFNLKGDIYMAQARIALAAGPEYADPVLEANRQQNYALFVSEQVTYEIPSGKFAEQALASPAWQEYLADRPADAPAPPSNPGEFMIGIGEVEPPERKNIEILIPYMSPHPATAKAGANAAAQGYKTWFEQTQQVADDKTIGAIETLIDELTADVDELTDERNTLLAGQTAEDLRSLLEQTQNDVTILGRQELLLKMELGQVPDPTGELTGPRTETDIINTDAVAAQLFGAVNQIRMEMDAERNTGVGENHPRMKRLRGQLKTAQDSLDQYIRRVQQGGDPTANTTVNGFGNAQAELQRVVAMRVREETRRSQLSQRVTRLLAIDRDRERLQERIADEQERLDAENRKQQLAQQDLVVEQIRIRGSAALPKKPFNTMQRVQFAMLLGGAGVMLSFGGVLLLGVMDGRMRYAADATVRLAGARMLGVLPTLPRKFKSREQADKAAHAVHRIRTLLQIGKGSAPGRIYTITSPAAGSGKSSLSVALGLSFASSGARTLLVDGDVVGAGLSRRLGTVVHHPLERLVEQRGLASAETLDAAVAHAQQTRRPLAEVLAERGIIDARTLQSLVKEQRKSSVGLMDAVDAMSLSGCVATTEVRNLYVLPVGDARPADAGNLSPKGLHALVEQARNEFDVVVIDTGPILGSIEASMAASSSDGVILVVSRGDSKSLSTKAIGHLESIDAPVQGVVFNHASDEDMEGSSYGSVVSKKRFDAGPPRPLPAFNPRFGPLGSAVVADVSAEDDPFDGVTHDLDQDRGGFETNGNGHAMPKRAANGRAAASKRRPAGRSG
ncbi:MAG: AAA family ATPase [Planctomycetota bacterium]